MEAKDMKAMREALLKVEELFSFRCKNYEDEVNMTVLLLEAKKAVRAALKKPPRNCDIGSVIEQGERFTEFCDSHNCRGAWDSEKTKPICPFTTGWDGDCLIRWMQMPYEAKKGVQSATQP